MLIMWWLYRVIKQDSFSYTPGLSWQHNRRNILEWAAKSQESVGVVKPSIKNSDKFTQDDYAGN